MDRHSPPFGKILSRTSAFKIARIAFGVVFSVVAVAFFILSATSSIFWKSRRDVSASLSSSSEYLLSVPGLLSLTGSGVQIKAFSASSICVAVGQAGDAKGWIGSNPYTRINGLSSWKNLESEPASGMQSYPERDSVPFQKSDMWEKVECGKSVDFEWSPGADQSLIVFNPARKSIVLNLGWKRVQVTDLSAPYAFFGCVSVLLAFVSLEFSKLGGKKNANADSTISPLPAAAKKTPRWVLDQLASDKRKSRILPRTVKSTKVFKIREKSEEDEVSTQVMDLSALRGMQVTPEDPKALKPFLLGAEPPSFPVVSSPMAAGTVFSVTSSKESDPSSKKKGPSIVDKSNINLLAKPKSDDSLRLHPEVGDLGAYFKRLREEKRGEGRDEKKA